MTRLTLSAPSGNASTIIITDLDNIAIAPGQSVDITDLFDIEHIRESTQLAQAMANSQIQLEYYQQRIVDLAELAVVLESTLFPAWTYSTIMQKGSIDSAILSIDMPDTVFIVPYDSWLYAAYARAQSTSDPFAFSLQTSSNNGQTWTEINEILCEGFPEPGSFPVPKSETLGFVEAGTLLKISVKTYGSANVDKPSLCVIGRQRRRLL